MQHTDQIQETPAAPHRTDPRCWVEAHGDALYRYALLRVRNRQVAEDLVQDTLLAALRAQQHFLERCSERTWLVSILKHKVIDHFRKASREQPVDAGDLLSGEGEDYYQQEGRWRGHWTNAAGPSAWDHSATTPVEQAEFWRILEGCLSKLPPRLAQAFWMREVEDLDTEEICKVLNVTSTNLWVMLHRARMQLRQGLEKNWFDRQKPTAKLDYAAVQPN